MGAFLTYAGIVLAIVSIWQGWLALVRSRRAAYDEFRQPFDEAVLAATNCDPFVVMRSLRQQHDAAISKFRGSVRHRNKLAFDNASEAFHKARDELSPALLAFYAERTGSASTRSPETSRLLLSIEVLLRAAK